MKKVFIVAQFVLLFVICGGVLWSIFKPVPKPDHDAANWNSWKGFFVISYQGVSKKESPEHVSAKQLEKHCDALKKAGYNTITPKDAAEFLAGKAPLPPKAILILFEGGRKDSFVYATPLLRKNRFFGVMCVPTKLTSLTGTFYLNQGDLKKITSDPSWILCSMGHRAIETIPIDQNGTKGHFLTNLMWTGRGSEDNAGFSERVTKDYEEASSILEKASGSAVAAYLYPFSDTGMKGGAQSLPARINFDSLKKFHKIAFTRADNPFNARDNSPYDLNRIRVPVQWDASRLISELEKYTPREKELLGPLNPEEYIATGDVKISPLGIALGKDSLAWVRGTDDWKNVDITARVSFEKDATAVLYGRYSGQDSYVRLSINSKGLRLQEYMGARMQTLVYLDTAIDISRDHIVRLRIRGNRAWATLDGKIAAGPVPLTMATGKGRVGFGSQGGSSQFAELNAKSIPSYSVITNSLKEIPPNMLDQVSAVLPLWFRSSAKVPLNKNQIMDVLVAASQGILTVPIVDAPAILPGNSVENFAGEIVQALSNPLIKPLIKSIAVRSPDENLTTLLRSRGYKIIMIVSAGKDGKLSLDTGRLHREDIVLIEGNEEGVSTALASLLRTIPEDRMIFPAEKKVLKQASVELKVYSGHI